jgi:hypothetical protein
MIKASSDGGLFDHLMKSQQAIPVADDCPCAMCLPRERLCVARSRMEPAETAETAKTATQCGRWTIVLRDACGADERSRHVIK